MRKISAFLFAMVCTLSMSAAIQSKLGIYMYSDANDWLEEGVLIGAGDSYAPFNDANCASYFGVGSNTNNYGVYAVYQGGNYSELYAPELVNIPLVVITSAEPAAKQGYSFYIEWNGAANNSQPVYLTDLRAPGGSQTVELTDTYEYAFDLSGEAAYVEGTKSVIADRFILNYNPSAFVTSVTTNEDGWASFAYTADVAPAYPAGLRIYKGALDNSNPDAPVINLTQVTAIPAGAGVFVKGEPLTTYHFSATTAAALTNNSIVGCTTATDPAGISDAIYTLRNVGGETALYHYEGTAAIPAGKAYLPIPVGSSAAPQRVRMVINEAQGVENVVVERVKAEKFVENGQLYIRRGNEVFNLQGQIVK